MAAQDKVIGFLDELLRKSGREPYLDMTDYMRGKSWVNGPVRGQQTIAIHSISVVDCSCRCSKQDADSCFVGCPLCITTPFFPRVNTVLIKR